MQELIFDKMGKPLQVDGLQPMAIKVIMEKNEVL